MISEELRGLLLGIYTLLLQKHDWTFEYSEDQAIWRRGSAELANLRQLQKQMDKKYLIWNEYAPSDFRR